MSGHTKWAEIRDQRRREQMQASIRETMRANYLQVSAKANPLSGAWFEEMATVVTGALISAGWTRPVAMPRGEVVIEENYDEPVQAERYASDF